MKRLVSVAQYRNDRLRDTAVVSAGVVVGGAIGAGIAAYNGLGTSETLVSTVVGGVAGGSVAAIGNALFSSESLDSEEKKDK